MTLNVHASEYIPPKQKIKDAFEKQYGTISAIKLAYYIPTRFFKSSGLLEFDEIKWNYELINHSSDYLLLLAVSYAYRCYLKAFYDRENGYYYGVVIPMKYMSNEDKELYLSYRLKQIYNPQNAKFITPCSYGKNLSHLFIGYKKKGKSFFKPLPQNLKLVRTYFGKNYEWNLKLIRTSKGFLLLKMFRKVYKGSTEE